MRQLTDAVVVITGASSGIGRASAQAFARAGATVVVAARRDQALDETVRDCEEAGARALAVPTDVADAEAVEELARRAVERFGRIDVWFNNAGVFLFGRLEETPPQDWRRVVDVDLMGTVHGMRAALPVMRRQGSGVIVNNASVYGKVAAPYVSAYVAAKYGVVGLSESVREELRLDGSAIAVCTLLPASIDTPIYQHAGNYTGRAIKPIPPTYDVEGVAEAVVRLARKPRPELIAGGAGRQLRRQRVLPDALFERTMARLVDREHFTAEAAPPTAGNLHDPVPHGTGVSGGWPSDRRPLLKPLLAVAAVAGGLAWLTGGGNSDPPPSR